MSTWNVFFLFFNAICVGMNFHYYRTTGKARSVAAMCVGIAAEALLLVQA